MGCKNSLQLYRSTYRNLNILKYIHIVILAFIVLSCSLIAYQNYTLSESIKLSSIKFVNCRNGHSFSPNGTAQSLWSCRKYIAHVNANWGYRVSTGVRIMKKPLDLQQQLLFDTKFSAKPCNGKVFTLLAINSHINNTLRRKAIRKTWGSQENSTNHKANKLWKVVFILGMNDNNEPNQALELESVIYGDIILSKVIEDHRNLTKKTVLGMLWAKKYCKSKYFLKTDDDVWINKWLMLQYLRKRYKTILPNNDRILLGYVGRKNRIPIRDPTDKYYVSYRDFSGALFPPYCSGFAYVMSEKVLTAMVDAMKCVPQLPGIDDVYIGILAKIINIKPKHSFRFHLHLGARQRNRFIKSEINNTLAEHGVISQSMQIALYKLALSAFNLYRD